MIKNNVFAAALALASLAALPACSGWNMGSKSSTAAVQPSPVSPDLVRQVQTSLKQQGLYTGNIDGQWGPQTQGAVRSYQQAHNMNPSGELNSQTLAALAPAGGGSTAATQPDATAPNMPAPAPQASTTDTQTKTMPPAAAPAPTAMTTPTPTQQAQ